MPLDMARIAEVSKVEFNQQLMHVHEGRVIPLAETGAAPQTRAGRCAGRMVPCQDRALGA